MTTLMWASAWDKALTAGLVIAVLELGRRAVGIVFPVLVSAGLAYALFGDRLPDALSHRGFDADFVTETILLGDLGIWGMLTGIAATVIAAFVLFGALLLHTGSGKTFMDLALRLGGTSPGGAAKVGTIASGLFGMVSGSSVANVATTGNVTIPMMTRLGYPRPLAAAVEAVASTGGQIAPPIMGAASFVMAEILGVSYVTVMAAAVLPAMLFYGSVFMSVHVIALRQGLGLVPREDLPAFADIFAIRAVLPFAAAMAALLTGILMGRSIVTAAFYAIVALTVAYLSTRLRTEPLGRTLGRLVDGLADAGKGLVIIGVLMAGAQILVSMINLTGVGVTLSALIVSLAGSSTVLVAGIVALVCLVMGMGLPTTAAYVLVAATLAPAMTEIGVSPLAAHMFVFYYATLSVITPPVCVAVFVGAGIAGTNWLPAGLQAVRLAALVYLVPFLFLLYPGFVGEGGTGGRAARGACRAGPRPDRAAPAGRGSADAAPRARRGVLHAGAAVGGDLAELGGAGAGLRGHRRGGRRRTGPAAGRGMTPSRRFVLVHGAWHGAWCWERRRPTTARPGPFGGGADASRVGREGASAAGTPGTDPLHRARSPGRRPMQGRRRGPGRAQLRGSWSSRASRTGPPEKLRQVVVMDGGRVADGLAAMDRLGPAGAGAAHGGGRARRMAASPSRPRPLRCLRPVRCRRPRLGRGPPDAASAGQLSRAAAPDPP